MRLTLRCPATGGRSCTGPSILTDGSGNVIAGYSYDVFGAIRTQSGAGDTDFKFTGEQLDTDEGLYFLRARYYDPTMGS